METLTENNFPEWFKYAFNFDPATHHAKAPYTYINELTIPGDIRSCRTIFINQKGLDFIGYTQAEVDQLGFDFYLQAVHPDDLKVTAASLEKKLVTSPHTLTVAFHRFRPKGSDQYFWFLCTKFVLEKFGDGSLKKVAIGAQMLNQMPDSEKMLQLIVKDLKQLNYNEKLTCLTPREMEVFKLVIKDKSNKEIAAIMFISQSTVKNHRYNLMQKLNVHSLVGLAKVAIESGLL